MTGNDIMTAMQDSSEIVRCIKSAAHRRYDRYLFSMCGLAGLLYGIDMGLIAAALPYIKETCDFSPAQLSSIVAAVLLGGIPGKALSAFVAERWGRLAAFRLTGVVFALAVPVICFSGGVFAVMFAGRLMQGVGCALVGISGPLYLAECVDAKDRGKGTGMIQLVLTVGLVVAALVGLVVTKMTGSASSPDVSLAAKTAAWQAIFWVSLVPTFALFIGSFWLKESPRWLFKKGRRADARVSLLMNNDEDSADRILAELDANAAAETASAADGSAAKETLLQRKYLMPLALACAVSFFTQASGINSVMNYSVVIMQKAGLAGTGANWADTAIKLTNFLMTIVAITLVDRRGRKFLLMLGASGITLGLSFVGAVFLALARGWIAPGATAGTLAAAGFVLFIASFAVGPGVCVWLANSELLPLRIRAGGMMVSGFVNMGTGWLLAQVFLPWSGACGESGVFLTLAGVAILFFFTVMLFLPETKGRTLEEIERKWSK